MGLLNRTPLNDGWTLEWSVAGRALEPPVSGDAHAIVAFEGGALIASIDGLGHGPEAAEAALRAVTRLTRDAGQDVAELIRRCHDDLRHTRGAVMSIASFDTADGELCWCGVGNVEAAVIRGDRQATRQREGLPLRGGVVGYQLPTVHASKLPIRPGDLLVMATDGIRGGFELDVDLGLPPDETADRLLAAHGRASDDALVLVVRFAGIAP